jgi:NTP pyrophosphatase (non-canonical NTP hydrolase)
MGKFKDEGDAALALAEECAEVIQIITKAARFGGDWNEIAPGKHMTRLEQLEEEMLDVFYQWERFKKTL